MTTTWEDRMAAIARPTPAPISAHDKPAPMPPEPAYALGLDEAARYLSVSHTKLTRLIEAGALPSFHIGSRHLVRRVDLEALADDLAAASYRFPQPRTAGECKTAAATCEREANTLRADAQRCPYPVRAQRYRAAAQAFASLAVWFRHEAGEEMEDSSAA